MHNADLRELQLARVLEVLVHVLLGEARARCMDAIVVSASLRAVHVQAPARGLMCA